MGQFLWAPKSNVTIDRLENIHNFTLSLKTFILTSMVTSIYSFVALYRDNRRSVWFPHILYEKDDVTVICRVVTVRRCVAATSILFQSSKNCNRGMCTDINAWTLCILLDFPIQIKTIRIALSIIYFEGSHVKFSNNYVFQSLKIVFILGLFKKKIPRGGRRQTIYFSMGGWCWHSSNYMGHWCLKKSDYMGGGVIGKSVTDVWYVYQMECSCINQNIETPSVCFSVVWIHPI